jgi:polyisoprenoid-binding protein YceI
MDQMMKRRIVAAGIAGLVLLAGYGTAWLSAGQQQAQQQPPPAGGGRTGGPPPPDRTKPHKLEITAGTKARYKVTEQLAGISFPSDAVGSTEAITGAIIINPDGSIGPESKLTVELKSLTSDQSMRDNYIQQRTLETEKFPTLVLVPKRAVGLPAPLPAGTQAQAGFQLVTDMTLHGVTKEVTWNVISTFGNTAIGGRATTTISFADFNMTKPTLARLLSVDDKIQLEIEFRCTRTAMP